MESADERFMAAALRLGRRGHGLTAPNPSVACLIVKDSVIIGRGVTAKGGRPHAETQALQEAEDQAAGATAYVTLEPCSHIGRTPPCAEALIAAKVARVVCASGDPDPRVEGRGFSLLREAGIAVTENVLAGEAARDHAGHIARVRFGRPFVQLKMAVSQDGMIGRRGERVALTSAASRDFVHMLRARSDAILVGVGTALVDDPMLTCRLPGMEGRSPVRVVLDSELRLPAESALVATAQETPTHVFTAYGAEPARAAALQERGVVVHRVPVPLFSGHGLELAIVLRDLVKLGVTRLMVEGGSRIAEGFLTHDLVDEVVLGIAPVMIGEGGVPVFGHLPIKAVTQGLQFEKIGARLVGPDQWERYWRRR